MSLCSLFETSFSSVGWVHRCNPARIPGTVFTTLFGGNTYVLPGTSPARASRTLTASSLRR